VERIGKRVGQVPPALLGEVDQALRVHLGLEGGLSGWRRGHDRL
jgi:hypothetical protein